MAIHMISISNIRGMLLEEAVLYLLQASGYIPVSDNKLDPTLTTGVTGLEVVGRGETHPVGAVAASVISLPFDLPQRLLLEAKVYADNSAIDMSTIRNAIGLLKDVEDNWLVTSQTSPPRRRYRYQYVICSPSGFTQKAQRYAFGQNIYLIDLSHIPQFDPLVQAIRHLSHNHFQAKSWNAITLELHLLREVIRELFNSQQDERLLRVLVPGTAINPLLRVVNACKVISGLLLATLGGHFTIPLIWENYVSIASLTAVEWVIYRKRRYWSLSPTNSDKPIYSFSFPPELLRLYAQQGLLIHPQVQIALKKEEHIQVVSLPLTAQWLDDLIIP